MAHDLVIRGGFIVDGTGEPGRTGDLADSGGRIAEVGTVSGRGAREVDAGGLVVAPGFIDPHTHYDAQLTWDPSASCTSWHGVTTIVTGNCGFTMAPCRPQDRLTLMKMLEYVEGMSLEAMQKGIQWELRDVPRVPRRAGSAAAVGQRGAADRPLGGPPVRDGRRGVGARRRHRTSSSAWAPRSRRAMTDGAIGFSSTTNMNHVGDRGRPVPSRLGTDHELEYLAGGDGLERPRHRRADDRREPAQPRRRGRSLHGAGAGARRPVTMVSVRHNPGAPDEHRQILAKVEAAWREGLRLHPQGTCSPLTSTFTITNGFVFGRYKAWRRVLEAKPSEWRAILADPALPRRLPRNRRPDRAVQRRHCPAPDQARGQARPSALHRPRWSSWPRDTGKDVIDAFFDLALDDDFRTEFIAATMNTDAGAVAEIFMHPAAVLGPVRRRRPHHQVLGGRPDEPAPRPLGARAPGAVAGGRGPPDHGGAGGDLRHSRPRPARPGPGRGHHRVRPEDDRLPRGRDRQRHAGRRAALRVAGQRHPVVVRQRPADHPRRAPARAAGSRGRDGSSAPRELGARRR